MSSIPSGTIGLSGGRPARLTQNLPAQNPSVKYNISTGLLTGCVICDKQENLSKCSSCSLVRYCGPEHQKADWKTHKSVCKAIKAKRRELFKEECVMCGMVGEQVFVNSKGLFWKNPETVDYMQARFKVAEEMMKLNTDLAVEEALNNLQEMNDLCRADNQGLRWIIPALLLRLGGDEEAYEYMKWWATKGVNYNFDDTSLPFLDTCVNDPYEAIDDYYKDMFLNHLVAFTLLKIRLLLDLQILKRAKAEAGPDFPLEKLAANLGKYAISSGTPRDVDFVAKDPSPLISKLEKQIRQLYDQVKECNPYFWPALLNPGEHLNMRPGFYTFMSEGEMQYALQYNYNAWAETPGAIEVIKALSSK